MAYYLVQASYTAEVCTAMINNPQDRAVAARQVIENLGGRLIGIWFAFGEYDLIAIGEMSDNATAIALSMAVSASGAFSSFKTTPLMTMEEGIEGMKKAGEAGYQPPGS